ncbi:hypothetical protein ADL19_05545 [Streptomyces purpurogeneiscleroticus]|nr:hypothetical protein ADL19_05545 [Streptomyces purpurogeneiscleroticus]
MKLADLSLTPDILAAAKRFQDDLSQDDDEFLADALVIGRDREISSKGNPVPLRVKFANDRDRMRYGVEVQVDQLRTAEADADPT